MNLYTIADLHLSFCDPDKTMEVFPGWEKYQERLEENWLNSVKSDDIVVLAGDISWGMTMQQALPDFRFLNELPGRKIILKGNHDYWWGTMNKMENFLKENSLDSINILHNNHYEFMGKGICGTRGWVSINGESQDEKVLKREVQRLDASIQSAVAAGLEPIVFMHYPPIFAGNFNYDILEVLYRNKIRECYYGHIHGRSAHELCVQGVYDDINFHLISGDFLQFKPERVM